MDSYSITIRIPNDPVTIDGKQFAGSINYTDQTDIFYYTAPRTGNYRFDFEYSNVNNYFNFSIYDSRFETLANLGADNGGKTVYLEKNETYEIDISEYKGLLEWYSISIGVPQKIKTISSFPINGKLTYKDQRNYYNYTAPYSGKYVFELSISDVNCYYEFVILDSTQEKIKRADSTQSKIEVNLVKDEIYRIQVNEYNGYPIEYTITQQ